MPPSITSTITGPTTVYSSWVTYTLNNVPEGLTVSWDVSSNLTTSTSCTPAPGTACIRVRASGVFNGSGFVRATVSGPCGDVMVPSYPVWVGTVTPLTGIIGFPYNGMEFGSNSVYNFSVYPPPAQGVNYTEWTVGGGTITQGQGSQQVSVLTGTGSDETPLYFNVNVRVGNTCGLSPWFMRTGYVVGGTGAINSFSVYPNPTTGMVTIAAVEDETNTMTASNHANEIHSVKIFDKMGMAVGSFNFSGQESQVNVNVSSLPKGVYLILINEKDRLTLVKE